MPTQWLGKIVRPGARPGATTSLAVLLRISSAGAKGIGLLVLRDEDETLRFLRGGPQEVGGVREREN